MGKDWDRALIALNKDRQPVGAVWYRLFDELNIGYGFVAPSIPELGIAVIKEARGLGLGTLLMKRIIQEALSEGFDSISLSLDPDNNKCGTYL